MCRRVHSKLPVLTVDNDVNVVCPAYRPALLWQ